MVRSAQEEQLWGKEQELSFEHVMLEPLREQNWDLDPSLPNSSHFVISVGQVSRGSRAQACRAVGNFSFTWKTIWQPLMLKAEVLWIEQFHM